LLLRHDVEDGGSLAALLFVITGVEILLRVVFSSLKIVLFGQNFDVLLVAIGDSMVSIHARAITVGVQALVLVGFTGCGLILANVVTVVVDVVF